MLQIKKILYPTDFSAISRYALDHALFLAEQFNAELHMLHVITLHNDDPYNVAYHFETPEEIHEHVITLAKSKMAELLEPYKDKPLHVLQIQRKESHPVPAILQYIEEQKIDLVVMGTHGRTGLRHMLQGSVAEETVRLSSCPVLTLHEHPTQKPIDAFNKLLIPIDFSESSKHALWTGVELARTYQAQLQLLHVIEPPSMPEFYVPLIGVLSPETLKELEQRAHFVLEQMMLSHKQTYHDLPPYTIHVVQGRSNSEIVQFAQEQHSDLIVISTHGLTGIQRVLFGSVAEYVVRHATCPVFTMKSKPSTAPKT